MSRLVISTILLLIITRSSGDIDYYAEIAPRFATCMKENPASTKINECQKIQRLDLILLADNMYSHENEPDVRFHQAFNWFLETIFDSGINFGTPEVQVGTLKTGLNSGEKRNLVNLWSKESFRSLLKFASTDVANAATEFASSFLKRCLEFLDVSNEDGKGFLENDNKEVQNVVILLTRGYKDPGHKDDIRRMVEPIIKKNGFVYAALLYHTSQSPSFDDFDSFKPVKLKVSGDDAEANITAMSKKFMNCVCKNIEDCQFINKFVDCHWENTGSGERCVTYNKKVQITRKDQPQPENRGTKCPTEVSSAPVDCEVKRCNEDCDLKGWEPWGKCSAICGPGKRRRKRLNKYEGDSEITESCRMFESEDCDERFCGDMSILVVGVILMCVAVLVSVGVIVWAVQRRKKGRPSYATVFAGQSKMTTMKATTSKGSVTKGSMTKSSRVHDRRKKPSSISTAADVSGRSTSRQTKSTSRQTKQSTTGSTVAASHGSLKDSRYHE